MSWTEIDDKEIQECCDRLIEKQKELNPQIEALQVILNKTVEIQTREIVSYNDKKEKITTKVPPKDKWGEDMTDEYRLVIKDECISKTNELLGAEDG